MKGIRRIALGVVVLSAVAGNVFAQGYPMPYKKGATAVTCPSNICPKTPGAPLVPYDTPMTRFVGRYVDSTLTRDYQMPLRTYRARGIRYSPERGKLYMMLGSTFAAYNLPQFVGGLTETGSHLAPAPVNREGLPAERYFPPHGSVYPEEKGSGWITPVRDGQDRLADFDWDDRGYNYLAYSIFSWGIVSDAAGKMALVKQVLPPESQDSGASMIRVVKSGAKYYVLVGAGGKKLGIWDVTNPATPVFVRILPLEVESWARTGFGGQQLIALGLADNSVQIFRVESLIGGGAADAVFPGVYRRTQISAEGSTFYVSTGDPGRSGYLSILRGSTAAPGAYTEQKINFPSGFYPMGVHVYNGMLTTWSGSDVKVYRILTATLEEVPLGTYFPEAYTIGKSGFALADGYTKQINGAAVVRDGGKDYLIYAGHGLGDVYEIQSRDSVNISARTTGTKNSFSLNKDLAPYYSDPMEFTVGASVATRVSINFDNAEAADNRTDVTTPQTYTRQYQGIVSATEIARTRNVTVAAVGDATNSDSTTVSLLVPSASAAVRSGAISTPLVANATARALFGDELVDTSDGRVEGHYAAWTIDAVASNRAPDTPLQLESCGTKTLSLASHYTPYTGSGSAVTASLPEAKHFIRTVSGVTLEVRPFVAALAAPVRNADGSVTFSSATRFSSAVVASGEATYTWKLLPPSGETPVLTQSGPVVISGAASDPDAKFTVPPAELVTGRRVVLEVSTTAFNANATGCSAAAYATSISTPYTMRVPDPAITITGCDRMGVLTNCKLIASSISGDMTGWSYTWKIDGTTVVNNSAAASTYDAGSKFTSSKTYTIELIASNVMGQVPVSVSHFVDKSQCDGKPANVSFTWSGVSSGCQFTGCTTREPFLFTPTAFGYQFQECDRFAWTFGTAGSSAEKNPTFNFPADGTYSVKLTVTNDNGSGTFTYNVVVGAGTPPPPPPPPPPTCKAPTNQTVFLKYSGVTSGCGIANPNCQVGETINFAVDTFGYTVSATCDTIRWEFGDGTFGSGQIAGHVYANPGTYTAKLTLSNSSGSVTKSSTFTVNPKQVVCNAIPVRAQADLNWVGAKSGCSRNNGAVCEPGESIRLTASPFSYTLQECDVIEWDFGDGTKGSGREVDHVFPLTNDAFEVTISIKNSATPTPEIGKNTIKFPGGGGTPPPTNAAITTEGSSYTANSAIQFSGAALGTVPETTWLWEFGDGTQSAAQNPTKTYAQPGTYTVKLTVKNGTFSSQWAITTKTITVTAGKAFRFLLPAVIHAKLPADGGTWLTDLHVFNPDADFGGDPLDLTFESAFAPKVEKDIDTSTYVQPDLMAMLTTTDGTQGAVIVSGVARNEQSVPQMWTRTYLQSSNGVGGFGQLVPAIRLDTLQGATTGARQYVLAGLRSDPRDHGFRTNVGIVNPTAETVRVKLRVYDNTDVLLFGNEQEFELEPYKVKQMAVTGPANAPFTARIISESGAPIFAYASMVDNVSNDPIFIEAVQNDAHSDDAYQSQILPGVGRLSKDNWKTDVTIYNPEPAGVQFDLIYYDRSGAKLAEAKDVTLGSHKFLQTRDILSAGLLAPAVAGEASGTLRLQVKSPDLARYPIIYGRTYSDQAGRGTFGQGIPAFAATKANVSLNRAAIIPGVQNKFGVFRSNVGIVSTSEAASEVRVTLLHPDTGEVLGQPIQMPLKAFQSEGPFDVFSAAFPPPAQPTTADRASVKIEVISGGPVWAYASLRDLITNDPEYIPAVPLR